MQSVNSEEHYVQVVERFEFEGKAEAEPNYKRIGWSLGNDCPFSCRHCYSMSARRKGANLHHTMVDRIVSQFEAVGVEAVTLGGNEPIFTNGLNVNDSLLPYILDQLTDHGIEICIITSGITAFRLKEYFPSALQKVDHLVISLDSPFEVEHNDNRGAKLFDIAIEALRLAQHYCIPRTILMCGMSWNFTPQHLNRLIELARQFDAFVRINPIKPVDPAHQILKLSPDQYYHGFKYLLKHCDTYEIGEPPLAAWTNHRLVEGCACGRSTFRVHSITPDGVIPVSPCIYMHNYKTGDLLKDDLADILTSPSFRAFRRRGANPELIKACNRDDQYRAAGGCTARAYLENLHQYAAS